MPATTPNPTPSDPHTRLRELMKSGPVSPEIADLRLMLLRQDYPDAVVQIDAVRADDTAVAVRVTIGLPGGRRHSAIVAADVDPARGWSDQLAAVQAAAVVNTLDGLGITVAPAQESTAAQPARQEAEKPAASPPRPDVEQTGSAAARPEEDHLPEYSWNGFWQAMNARGINRDQVEQALGKSVQDATPKEAFDALKAAGKL